MQVPTFSSLKFRVLFVFSLSAGIVTLGMLTINFFSIQSLLLHQVRKELQISVGLGANQFEPREVELWLFQGPGKEGNLKDGDWENAPAYQNLHKKLNSIQKNSLGSESLLYLFRAASEPEKVEYLAFSQTNDQENSNTPFQIESSSDFPSMQEALRDQKIVVEPQLTWDPEEKNHSISAYAPLPVEAGYPQVFLGIDFKDRGMTQRILESSIGLGGMGLAMLLLLMATGVFLARKLKKSFFTINRLVEDLALGEGDLKQRIEIFSKDELGLLAKHLNHFIGSIHQIVLNVQTIGDTQERLSNQIETILSEHNIKSSAALTEVHAMDDKYQLLSSSVRNTVTAVRAVGESLEDLQTSMAAERQSLEASASAMEIQVDSMENISRIAAEKKSLSEEIQKLTHQGFQTVRQSFKYLEMAAADLNQIRNAIALIQDISENTNLLAMNAAIEAAHAGEKGKGFAVIAGEIRGLSLRTQTNARSITENLENLISNLGQAQTSGKASTESLQTINQGVEALVQSFLSILDLLTRAGSGNITIKNSIQELKKLSFEVTQRSDIINQKAQEGQTGMEMIAAVNMEIQRALEGVKSKIQELSIAADHLRELGEDNSGILSELLGEISRFKT